MLILQSEQAAVASRFTLSLDIAQAEADVVFELASHTVTTLERLTMVTVRNHTSIFQTNNAVPRAAPVPRAPVSNRMKAVTREAEYS